MRPGAFHVNTLPGTQTSTQSTCAFHNGNNPLGPLLEFVIYFTSCYGESLARVGKEDPDERAMSLVRPEVCWAHVMKI